MEKLVLTNNGYLYVEMITGLMLIFTMIFVFFPPLNVKIDGLTFKSDVKKLELIIDQMRVCAIKNEKSKLKFAKNSVETLCGNQKKVQEFSFDIKTNFINDQFTFNENGNISRAGTLSLQNNNYKHKIVLHIGYGL